MKRLFTQYGGLKREIYIIFVGQLVTAMGSFVWPMLTFFLTTKLGIRDSVAAALLATVTILSLPLSLVGGKLADKFNRKHIIIAFDILAVSFYILAAIIPISIISAALIFVSGMFQTLESPAYSALSSDFSTTEQRERAFSLSYLGFNLGFIVGASVSGLLFKSHTQLAFLLNGLAILTSTVLIFFFVNMKNAVGKEEGSQTVAIGEYEKPVDEKLSVLSVLRDRKAVLWVLVLGCVGSMLNNLLGILLPLQLKDMMAEDGSRVYGYLSSLNGATVILLTPLLTMLMRRISEIPKSAIGLALFLTGTAMFSVKTALWVLYVGMFVFTAGEVVSVIGGNPYASRRIPSSHRGRVGGVTSVVTTLVASLTQYAIALILGVTNNNYAAIWYSFAAIGVVGVVLYAVVYPMDKRKFPKLYEGMRI